MGELGAGLKLATGETSWAGCGWEDMGRDEVSGLWGYYRFIGVGNKRFGYQIRGKGADFRRADKEWAGSASRQGVGG